LQKEVASLQSEIDRIADETNFNGINLLDGSLGAAATQTELAGTDAVGGTKAAFTLDLGAAYTLTDTKTLTIGDVVVTGDATNAASATATQTALSDKFNGKTVTIGGMAYTASVSGSAISFVQQNAADVTLDATTVEGYAVDSNGAIGSLSSSGIVSGVDSTTAAGSSTTKLDFTGKTGTAVAGSSVTIGSKTYEFVKTGGAVTGAGNTAVTVGETDNADAIATALKTAVDADATVVGADAGHYSTTVADGALTFTSVDIGSGVEALEIKQTGTGLNLQIGDTATQRISVKVSSMDSKSLGVDVSKVNISSEDGAKNAISIIKEAINSVSGTRADLGAIQNRLEYTVNNLATTTENLTSAESRIRDTDMASEMMAYTKNNVLSQAAQAMLAQANQQPQQVLQLLQ
ncbi:MAG TPA: flagellin, partial [Clostridia bacterium]|nr:flagellin [Clostridia bacterium]